MNELHPSKDTKLFSVYTTDGFKVVAAARFKGLLTEGESIIPGTYEVGTVGEEGELVFHLIVDQRGYTGIGTLEPTARLHVQGNIRFSEIPGEGNYIYIDEDGYLSKTHLIINNDKNLVLPVNYKLFEVIAHNLGKKPAVSVLDSDNKEGLADIEHIDDNTVKVTFSDYFTGKIVFN